jgi:hypothetical protein
MMVVVVSHNKKAPDFSGAFLWQQVYGSRT